MTTLVLRRATAADRDRLLEWRNDPLTRRWSFGQSRVSAAEHDEWFTRKLQDPDCALFIAVEDDTPIGQVRLDLGNDAEAEVSIALAPQARGRRMATDVLRLAASRARELQVAEVTARVNAGNTPSLRAFQRAGYAERRREPGVVVLSCDLRSSEA